MKKLLIVGGIALGLFLAAVAVLLWAMGDGIGRDEVARLTSPTGEFDAVVFEINGGATTAFAYEIHVVKAGDKLKPMNAIEGGDAAAARLYANAFGPMLVWPEPNRLVVQHGHARQADVRAPAVAIGNKTVSVELQEVLEPIPPPGGLLYECCPKPHILRPGDPELKAP